MNRLIRNRDILVIIMLIVFICLFNFHISHGDRAAVNQPLTIINKPPVKSKGISSEDHGNLSQLNDILHSPHNETNSSLTTSIELVTTLAPITTAKQSFFKELVSSKDFRKICSNNKSPIINITLDEELYRSNSAIDCSIGSFIVFLVTSHIDHRSAREKIRQSWASLRQLRESKLTTLFFVYSDKPISDKQKSDLKSENDQYVDVVLIPITHNMKTEVDIYLKMLQFSVFSCMQTEYFVIVDDAVFVNLPSVFDTIITNKDIRVSIEEKRSLMLCRVKKNIVAVRNKKSPWFVSNKDWADKHYPPYCDLTNGVIMSQQVARDILMCSFYEKRLWINDVFVTGILPQKMSIIVEAFMEDFSVNVMANHHIYEDLSRSIFLTEGLPYNERMWRLLFNKSLR